MKKNKLFVAFTVLSFIFALCGCSEQKPQDVTDPLPETTSATEPSTASPTTPDGIIVNVTVSDKTPILTQVAATVTDTDADGLITICDALFCAHEQYYETGTEGFGCEPSEYGISLTKLAGKNQSDGAAFGYYLNNASPMSLLDEVKDGDSVYAFVFSDSVDFSDTYCYFNENNITISEGDHSLTLTSCGFDENWAPVTAAVEGAEITVDGEKTGILTDAEGKATITLSAGDHVISAISDNIALVPPVCIAKVTK